MNIFIKSIPNSITCLNLASGVAAIACAFRPGDFIVGTLPGWECAVILIFAAAVFDFLDGFAARLLKAYSDTGKELDSLSDLVSFGVAPAFLLYNMLAFMSHDAVPVWLTAMLLLIPVMGALRLARFNVRDAEGDNSVFHGLPIPANALFWMGYTSWIWHYGLPESYVVAIGVLLVSLAMVSNLTLPSLKFHNLGWRDNIGRFFIIAVTVALVIVFGLSGLMWSIIVYMIMGVFYRIKTP